MAQDRAGGDHDRQLARGDGELAQEPLNRRVALGVQPLVGDAVAGQELPDPEQLGREAGPHDAQGSRGAVQQPAPAGEKGGEDGVAEAGVRRDHVLQRSPRHHEDFARLNDVGRQIHPLTGQQVQLAQEAPRSLAIDDSLLAVGMDRDLDYSREDHVEVVGGVPLSIEILAHGHRPPGSERRENG